jgi:hypothetical protein
LISAFATFNENGAGVSNTCPVAFRTVALSA